MSSVNSYLVQNEVFEAINKTKKGVPTLTKVTSDVKLKNLQLGLLVGSRKATHDKSHTVSRGNSVSSNESRNSRLSARDSSRASMYSWRDPCSSRGSERKKKRIYERKIGKWNPADLANKIREKHNIKKLVENKIIMRNPEHHFEMINSPSKMPMPK